MSTIEAKPVEDETRERRGTPSPSSDRVLVAVSGAGNRSEIQRLIGQHYELVAPDDGAFHNGDFDVAITDGPGLPARGDALGKARSRERPVFLPVMLILPRPNLRERVGDLVSLVDDFITAPIDRGEFVERVQMLLRGRDETARHFYQHFGFEALPESPQRLVMPMATVSRLFASPDA